MEKRYDIETLLIDRVLNKNIYMKKLCRKCIPKASLKFPFNFVNNPKQPLHAIIFIYFERGLSKP